MHDQWPALGPAHLVRGFIEPMEWGRPTYTVIGMPEDLVEAARNLGTRRVAGELDGVAVNLRRLVPVENAVSAAARARRSLALLDGL